MSFTLSLKAFAHDVNYPPSMQSNCDVSISLVDTMGVFQVLKEAVASQTEYKIVVPNPMILGIVSYDQTIVNRAVQDLVLACNIVLGRVALSTFRLEVTEPSVVVVSPPTRVVVKDTPSGKIIESRDEGHARDEAHITVVVQEALDESRTVEVCKQLAKLKRFSLSMNSSIHRAILINALHEYETAMASLDRLLTFKHLYTVLELVTNIDRTNGRGSTLDARMALVTGASQNECEDWRNLNNRTKHIHRSSTDIATFMAGLEKLTDYIPVMRQASAMNLAKLLM